jgi:hypothetical protein
MKIYAKTEMTELPKGCRSIGQNDCVCLIESVGGTYNCFQKMFDCYDDVPTTRPDWCPLVTEKEILEEENARLRVELAALKAENEKLKRSLNDFIEELAWRDVQWAASASGMSGEACGQPSRVAISVYRNFYDKLYEDCNAGQVSDRIRSK